MLGKIEGRRRRGWQRMRWLDGITDSIDVSLSKLQETVKDRKVWHISVHRVAESDMTEHNIYNMYTDVYDTLNSEADKRIQLSSDKPDIKEMCKN